VSAPEAQAAGEPPMIMNPGLPHPKMLLQTLAWNNKGKRQRGQDHWQVLKHKDEKEAGYAPGVAAQPPVARGLLSSFHSPRSDANTAEPVVAAVASTVTTTQTFSADQWDSSDSDDGDPLAAKDWDRNASVFCYGLGKEVACKVMGRCVNHKSRRVNKYTLMYPDGSYARVRACDVYWPSRVVATTCMPPPKPVEKSSSKNVRRGASKKGGSPGKRRSRSSSSSSGSSDSATERDAGKGKKKLKHKNSSSSDDDRRMRACKFNYKHDDKETNTIFWQLSSDVPWLHSRNGQKAIWRYHLSQLHKEGHALELVAHKDALKTFIAWAAAICKARRTFRLAEARKSGIGHMTLDYVDDVSERWELKVLGDSDLAAMQGEKAGMMRDVMCTTAGSLDAKSASILAIRSQRYAVKKRMNKDDSSANAANDSRTPSKTSTTSKNSSSVDMSPAGRASPALDARADLLQKLNDMAATQKLQEEKDKTLVANLFASFTSAQQGTHYAAASQLDDEIAKLREFLEQEDASLTVWAPAIHAALGVSRGDDFKEISVSDITNAAGVPQLQKNRLLNVAKRYGVKE
jgi:hypothetical protein